MCSPQALQASNGALQIGATLLDFVGRSRNFERNQEAALSDFRRNVEGLNERGTQTSQAAAEEILNIGLQEARDRAAANATSASAGTSRSTARALAREVGFSAGRSKALTRTNRDNELDQIGREIAGAQINAQSRINSLDRPSVLATALQIGAQATDTALQI